LAAIPGAGALSRTAVAFRRRHLQDAASVLEGDMEFEVEGQVHQPQPGQELLIPVAAVHSARNIGSTTARWLYG
jgi:quercetin dioxygenase-like cupin family protein